MKNILLSLISLFWSYSLLYATNPIISPTFQDVLKEIIGDQEYIFDDKNIIVKVPSFADNPVQVPIFVDAKKIKDAKRMILFADLNPITRIVDMDLTNLLPLISLNIRVAQETPLRALVLDSKGVWHIGSKNIKSFGGGCSVASVASSDTNFDKLLGKGKISYYKNDDTYRIKTSIFHPMETGLVFGNSEFYINKVVLKAEEKILASIKTYSPISENPRFIFETKEASKEYELEFYDIDGNQFLLDTK